MMPSGAETERKRSLDRVRLYHEQTKHHLHAYARSLGWMDWATQPKPFRRYEGAPLRLLSPFPVGEWDSVPYHTLFEGSVAGQSLTRSSLSAFFFHALAISAWKESGGSRWSLRVNPSSGNLHPTEAYLISGAIPDLLDSPAICHYDPYYHGLEERLALSEGEWNQLWGRNPEGGFLIGLTSIHWREIWKYGERAYRYCQHDLGHAMACLQISAALFGWEIRPVKCLTDRELAVLVGVADQAGPEREYPAVLLGVVPRAREDAHASTTFLRLSMGSVLIRNLQSRKWRGSANELSAYHQSWPVIEMVQEAVENDPLEDDLGAPIDPEVRFRPLPNVVTSAGSESASQVIRRRRSAVAMDGSGTVSVDVFYRMLWRLHPTLSTPFFKGFPICSGVALLCFVHRVKGLESGLYIFSRYPGQRDALRRAFRGSFEWQRPVGCPPELSFDLLRAGDFQESARTVSCHQSIASDGVFAVSMLADYDRLLEAGGAAVYPRLYWECGVLGQLLYLEAEASELQATGIGCFFDDAVHRILGIEGSSWQGLYHFTVGGGVADERVREVAAYAHLTPTVLRDL